LKEITKRLLHSETYGERRQAALDLLALFSSIVELGVDFQHADRNETLLNVGKAISPYDAAQCILDFERTRKFLSGMRAFRDKRYTCSMPDAARSQRSRCR
jgi:hypothetical protein